MNFSIANSRLEINGLPVTFVKRPEKALEYKGRLIVLLGHQGPDMYGRNIVALNERCELLWRSKPSGGEKALYDYSDIWTEEDRLMAFGLDCFECQLDPETGLARRLRFTK